MPTFNKYAHYYDQLYQDKNYLKESNFIDSLIKRYSKFKDILEMGCGTGIHACHLVKKGYSIKAFDISHDMLEVALSRRNVLPKKLKDQVNFISGNIIKYQDSTKFNIVLSLFHILSYVNKTEDLYKTFINVKHNLKPGGIFIFDFWYGPSVLSEKPTLRIKEVDSPIEKIIRIASPVLRENKNIVDVNYHLIIKNLSSDVVHEIKETHSMRYFFLPEIIQLLNQTGLEFITAKEWLTDKEPGIKTWGVYVVAKNKI